MFPQKTEALAGTANISWIQSIVLRVHRRSGNCCSIVFIFSSFWYVLLWYSSSYFALSLFKRGASSEFLGVLRRSIPPPLQSCFWLFIRTSSRVEQQQQQQQKQQQLFCWICWLLVYNTKTYYSLVHNIAVSYGLLSLRPLPTCRLFRCLLGTFTLLLSSRFQYLHLVSASRQVEPRCTRRCARRTPSRASSSSEKKRVARLIYQYATHEQ